MRAVRRREAGGRPFLASDRARHGGDRQHDEERGAPVPAAAAAWLGLAELYNDRGRKAKAEVILQDWSHNHVLRAVAKMEGVWGNGVRLGVDYNTPNPGETFNLRVSQEEGGKVVAVQQGRILGTAFHPELTPTAFHPEAAADGRFHRYFLDLAAR